LEEMQFFMHRITHEIFMGIKEMEKHESTQEQIKRLNMLASIHEGRDGMA